VNPTDRILLWDIILHEPTPPEAMKDRHGIPEGYVASRLREIRTSGWAETPYQGFYWITEAGRQVVHDEIDPGLDLILAYRLIDQDWQIHGERGVLALQFVDGTVAAFRLTGAADEQLEQSIGLNLEPIRTWDSADAVRDHVDRITPKRPGRRHGSVDDADDSEE